MGDVVAKLFGVTLFTLMGVAFLGLLGVVLGTLFGAIGGWFVGLFFGEIILGVLAKIGLTGVTMWEFGATLGFVGGFFKTIVTK